MALLVILLAPGRVEESARAGPTVAPQMGASAMCRNIKMLFNFDPPVTEEEIRAASLQFVRKLTGFNKPSKANEAAFLAAVEDVAAVSARLLASLETTAPPRSREEEAARAKARNAARFGQGKQTA
jgi:hypothetical protein